MFQCLWGCLVFEFAQKKVFLLNMVWKVIYSKQYRDYKQTHFFLGSKKWQFPILPIGSVIKWRSLLSRFCKLVPLNKLQQNLVNWLKLQFVAKLAYFQIKPLIVLGLIGSINWFLSLSFFFTFVLINIKSLSDLSWNLFTDRFIFIFWLTLQIVLSWYLCVIRNLSNMVTHWTWGFVM